MTSTLRSRLASLDLLDYVKKQVKFSLGNIPSVPVGFALLYVFTQYLGIWYIYSSLLSLVVTTIMNFNIQILLRVVRVRRKEKA